MIFKRIASQFTKLKFSDIFYKFKFSFIWSDFFN